MTNGKWKISNQDFRTPEQSQLIVGMIPKREDLIGMAGNAVFRRGEEYQARRCVRGLTIEGGRIIARVYGGRRYRNVTIVLRHLGEKFRLQKKALRPPPAAVAGG